MLYFTKQYGNLWSFQQFPLYFNLNLDFYSKVNGKKQSVRPRPEAEIKKITQTNT